MFHHDDDDHDDDDDDDDDIIPHWISMGDADDKSFRHLTWQRPTALVNNCARYKHWHFRIISTVKQLCDSVDCCLKSHQILVPNTQLSCAQNKLQIQTYMLNHMLAPICCFIKITDKWNNYLLVTWWKIMKNNSTVSMQHEAKHRLFIIWSQTSP